MLFHKSETSDPFSETVEYNSYKNRVYTLKTSINSDNTMIAQSHPAKYSPTETNSVYRIKFKKAFKIFPFN